MTTCTCLQCRIRQAISQPAGAAEPTFVDLHDLLAAMSPVLSEALAHAPDDVALMFIAELLVKRRIWQSHPRVMVQRLSGGTA